MAERVASMLHLNDDETFFKSRDVSLLGILGGALSSTKTDLSTSAREAWAANIVLGNVTVLPVPGSRLVDVSYLDPNRAARSENRQWIRRGLCGLEPG